MVVTGGAGFIGSHLVDYLIKKRFEVLVIDNLSSGSRKNLNPKASFNKLDVNNKNQVNQCFRKFLPDYVVHLAGIISKSPPDTKIVKKVNVGGTINILNACVINKVKKIIFSSSAAVYGETNKFPTDENQKLSPINPYGMSKAEAESEILSFSQKYDLNYAILRYSNVYGPRQKDNSEGGVISIFCKNIGLSKNVIVYGNGRQTRDFIYIDDVTKANHLSMISPVSFIANVGTTKETSVLSLVKVIEKISQKKMKIIFRPAKKGEIRRSCLNNYFIKPRTRLEAGIRKTYYWHAS